ncbi:flagellar assembly protein A [Deferrisoma sp.]
MAVRIELRKGGLEAVAYRAEGPFDLEEATRAALARLAELGVQPAPSPDRIRMALSVFEGGQAPEDGVVIARGEPPQPGVPAQILPFFPVRKTPLEDGADPFALYPQNAVYPGDPLLQKTPASAGIPGKSLLGTPIPAPDGRDIPVLAGDGVADAGEDHTFRAEAYGIVLFDRGRLWVAPGLAVSDDRMEARLTVVADPKLEEEAQVRRLLEALGQLGVRAGVDAQAVAAAVREARTCGQPVVAAVARGREPVHGREAGYRLLFDPEKKIGKVLDGGRIDFREAEAVKNVRKGDALAEVIPAVEPVDGFRVDGTRLRAKLERFHGLKPGDNTAPSEDGTRILAAADGMVVLKAGKFHIVDEYLVPGDVDYRTGNIRASGAVRIRGGVKPGFQVEAGRDVEISGDVETATIRAGGTVTIRGGVTAEASVFGGRGVKAKYVLSSRVESDGDVEVANSITNALVYTRGRVRALAGQGALLGGEINAALGIEARVVGSASAQTHVAVGVDLRVTREIEKIDKERAAILDEIKILQSNLGRDFLKDPRTALARIPPPLRKGKIDLLQKMQALYQRDRELTERRDELAALQREQQAAQVAVAGEIHAGTRVTCSVASVVLTETLRHVVLYYDPETNRVAWRRM